MAPSEWLVLPDEPPVKALSLPEVAAARPRLPALAVAYPSWSASNEGWRAEKPLKPWFNSPAPYAVAVAMGAVSLDLTAVGLGVPEIVPTHGPLHDGGGDRDFIDAIRLPFEHDWSDDSPALAPALFGAPGHGGFGIDVAVWDQPDAIVPSWQGAHEASNDWWA
jgi:hypothetical protein